MTDADTAAVATPAADAAELFRSIALHNAGTVVMVMAVTFSSMGLLTVPLSAWQGFILGLVATMYPGYAVVIVAALEIGFLSGAAGFALCLSARIVAWLAEWRPLRVSPLPVAVSLIAIYGCVALAAAVETWSIQGRF
ncbi:MAG: hypothetical protein F4018_01950 [Acidobacteria bacterium]|nr:hypothetical protein [Acidobacteriota bacterium]